MTVTVERAREILLELVPRLATIFQATRLPTVTDEGVLTDGQKSEPAGLMCEHAFVAQVLDWYGPTLESPSAAWTTPSTVIPPMSRRPAVTARVTRTR